MGLARIRFVNLNLFKIMNKKNLQLLLTYSIDMHIKKEINPIAGTLNH